MVKFCSVDRCPGKGMKDGKGVICFPRGYCAAHYMRFKKYGKVDNNPIKPRSYSKISISYPKSIYVAWAGMKARCYNKNHKDYRNYGGRGIKVHPSWINSFLRFYEHIGDKPTEAHSIDRINNNGDYEPGNVRWATRQSRNFNKRPRREWVTK